MQKNKTRRNVDRETEAALLRILDPPAGATGLTTEQMDIVICYVAALLVAKQKAELGEMTLRQLIGKLKSNQIAFSA